MTETFTVPKPTRDYQNWIGLTVMDRSQQDWYIEGLAYKWHGILKKKVKPRYRLTRGDRVRLVSYYKLIRHYA